MSIQELKADLARRNLKGLHFILASIFLWIGIFLVWYLPIGTDLYTRNLLTFFCTAPLMPLAFFFAKIIKAEFSVKDNPLNELGILFSLNQILYISIAMWAFNAAPDKMVMILAIIFGAHLLPFAWLYQSGAYLIMAIVIPICMLIMGHDLQSDRVFILAAAMIALESVFATWLTKENKKLQETFTSAVKK